MFVSQPAQANSRKLLVRGSLALLLIVVASITVWAYSSYVVCACYNPTAVETKTLPNGTVVYIYPTIGSATSDISVNKSQTFIVQLQNNGGSTGYDWNVKTSAGIRFVNSTTVSGSGVPGAPVTQYYYFQATQAGSQSISLVYERSFSGEIYATITIYATVS